MSQSPLTINYEIQQVLAKLDQRLDKIENKIDNLQKDVTEVKISQARLEGKIDSVEAGIKGDIKTLDEKVNGLSKRLEFQEFVNKGVLVGLVVAIIGGAAKLFGWVGNP